MTSISSIALSGLRAATARVGVSADNVVNVRTGRPVEVEGETPEGVYEPKKVEQIPLEHGGVRVAINSVTPSTLLLADLDSPTGVAEYPNVDLTQEVVNQRLAVRDFKAALAVIEAEDEMFQAVLDIKT